METMTRSIEHRLAALEAGLAQIATRVARLEPRPGPRALTLPAPPQQAWPAAPAPRPAASVDLEDLLGRHGLALAGGAAVLAGLAFFVALAASRGWLAPPVRVALAAIASYALVAAGAWLHERRARTTASLALVGTGIAGMFLTVTAGTATYRLVPTALGLAAALAIGALATALAVRWDAQPIAGLGVVGALCAPVLTAAEPTLGLIGFLAVALAAAAAVLVWRRWEWVGLVAIVVTTPQLGAWVLGGDPPARDALPVLALFAALHVAAAVGYEWRPSGSALRASSGVLVSANAAVTAGLGTVALDGAATPTGRWLAGLALAHGLVAALSLVLRPQAVRGIAVVLASAGLALANLAAIVLVDGVALPVGWAASAVVIGWLGREDPHAARAVTAQLVLAVGHVALVEAPVWALAGGVDSLTAAVSSLVAITVAGAVLRPARPRLAAMSLLWLASVSAVTVLAGQGGQLLLSALWAATGLAALLAGLASGRAAWSDSDQGWTRAGRRGGMALLCVALGKAVMYDLAALDSGYRAASFVLLGLLLIAGGLAYQRRRAVTGTGAGAADPRPDEAPVR